MARKNNDTMERVVTMTEKYDEKEGEFIYSAICPFDHRKVVFDVSGYEPVTPDKHFVRAEHGCGGDIAVFRKV